MNANTGTGPNMTTPPQFGFHPSVETRLTRVAEILTGYADLRRIRGSLFEYGLTEDIVAEELNDKTVPRGDLKNIFGVDRREHATPPFVANKAIAVFYGSMEGVKKLSSVEAQIALKRKDLAKSTCGRVGDLDRVGDGLSPIETKEELFKEMQLVTTALDWADPYSPNKSKFCRPCYVKWSNKGICSVEDIVFRASTTIQKILDNQTANLAESPITEWAIGVINLIANNCLAIEVMPKKEPESQSRTYLGVGSFEEVAHNLSSKGWKVHERIQADPALVRWISQQMSPVATTEFEQLRAMRYAKLQQRNLEKQFDDWIDQCVESNGGFGPVACGPCPTVEKLAEAAP